VLTWTSGQALVATGSPFGDVDLDERAPVVARSNNIYVFPGLGASAMAARATAVTDSMLRAAAAAVADTSPCTHGSPTDALLPPLTDVASTSRRIALAVAAAARDAGVGDEVDDELAARLTTREWSPTYPEIIGTP
jgi:malate dehydrogenase (oxaloacetate-decarboxylating)